MRHAQSGIIHAASGRKSHSDPAQLNSRKMIARSGHKKACLPSSVVLAGLVLALLGDTANASSRTTILDFICETYESARQVALDQSWKRPESLPGDCRTLFRRGYEGRIARISQIIEVVPMGDGRWVEIGRVRRSSAETGYSAGITEQLLLF